VSSFFTACVVILSFLSFFKDKPSVIKVQPQGCMWMVEHKKEHFLFSLLAVQAF